MKQEELDHIFSYHKPFGNQASRYEELRFHARELALSLNILCPESREKSLAITKLQESIMFANASIAIHEKPETSLDIHERSIYNGQNE